MKVKFIEQGNATEHNDVIAIKLENELEVTTYNFSKFCEELDELIMKFEITEED